MGLSTELQNKHTLCVTQKSQFSVALHAFLKKREVQSWIEISEKKRSPDSTLDSVFFMTPNQKSLDLLSGLVFLSHEISEKKRSPELDEISEKKEKSRLNSGLCFFHDA